jgi:hypothetical protein
MASLRFATLRDLYEAFSTAQDDIEQEPNDHPVLAFLQQLREWQSWQGAISLCAYLLPRREAVWWGCRSLRRMIVIAGPEPHILAVAEAWVREPNEDHRLAALHLGGQADSRLPSTWMALAAGWSGGSIVAPEYGIVPAAPQQTARAVRAGLMIAMTRVPNDQLPQVMPGCIDAAIAMAGSAP